MLMQYMFIEKSEKKESYLAFPLLPALRTKGSATVINQISQDSPQVAK